MGKMQIRIDRDVQGPLSKQAKANYRSVPKEANKILRDALVAPKKP